MASGRVKEEVLSVIFAHYFPHFNDLRVQLDKKVYSIAKKYKQSLLAEEDSGLVVKLFKSKKELTFHEEQAVSCCTAQDVRQLWNFIYFPCKNDIIEVYNAIQDLSRVMEIKFVAKHSQGSYVEANRQEFEALKRVCDNIDYYKELDMVIDEIEYE